MPSDAWPAIGPQLEVLALVVGAMILGGFIGLDREAANKPAGLRTHMLVAGSAALLVGLGPILVSTYEVDGDFLRTDPIRIVEAVITGVSFLGAGTIIRGARGDVQGLTTAASVLFCAGVGVTVGVSQWLLACGATAIAVITLALIRKLEERWFDDEA